MSDRPPFFKKGDRIITCGEARRQLGRIVARWGTCEMHGDETYLVAFPSSISPGTEIEIEICESVLALPNDEASAPQSAEDAA